MFMIFLLQHVVVVLQESVELGDVLGLVCGWGSHESSGEIKILLTLICVYKYLTDKVIPTKL